MKQLASSLVIVLFIVCCSRLSFSQVAIGTGATAPNPDTNAVLLLEGNGSQGIIIPKVSSLGAFGKPGMIVYNTATGTVHYFNTTWVQVGSGGAGSQGIQIVGNKVLIGTGAGFSTEFSIANTAPTIQGQILMWDTSLNSGAGGWTSSANTAPSTVGQVLKWNGSRWEPGTDNTGAVATLSGDVSGATTSTTISTTAGNSIATALNNGATTSRILESRITPSGTNNQVLTTVGGVTQWANPTGGALPSLSANQLVSNNGANTAITVAGDVGLSVTGTTGTFTIANSAITDAKVATGISGSKINPAFGTQNITTTTGSASIGGGLNVGLANGFTINNAGNITKINGATTSFPTTNAAGVLTNDGTGTLTWAAAGGGVADGSITGGTAGVGVKIAANTITDANILSLDAGKITSGTLPTARIAAGAIDNTKLATGIDAAKITTGTLPVAQVPNIDGTKIIDGTVAGTDLATNIAITTTGNIATTGTLNTGAATVSGLTIGTSVWPANASGSLTNNGSGVLTWVPSGGSGTVTSITKGIGLVAGAPITTSGTIDVNVGTGANQIVQLDATGKLPAIDGSQLTGLAGGGDITGVTAGTGLTGGAASGNATLNVDVGTTANKIVQLDATGKLPVIDGSQLTNLPAGAETDPTVTAINGIVKSNGTTISAATAGTDYLTPTGSAAGLTGLTAAQIPNLDAAKITTGTLSTARLDVGTSANQIVQLDGTGKLPAVDGSQLTGLAGGGDITGVTAGTGLTGGAASGNATLNVDVGTTANKIVQLDGTGKLPAIDGSQLTGLAGGGDITGVTAGTGLTGGAASGNATLNVDVGTTANKIVQLDATGKLPVIDGSQLTNLPAGAETDPTVTAINGLVKSNGTTISAATAGTDYLTPTGSAAGLTGLTSAQIPNLDAAKITTGTLPVAIGGTGATTLSGLVVGNGASPFTAVTTGSNGQILTVSGGNPTWQNAPAPSGSAGGDLLGSTYPNPVIAAGAINSTKLATNAVATANIANGAVTDAKINDVAPSKITAGGATNGQVLKFNGTNWVAQADNVGGGGAPTLNPGQIIVGDGTSNSGATVSLDANLNSTNGNITVQGLQGRPISAAVPANNSVYQFNGTQWAPVVLAGGGTVSSIATGTGLTGGPITGTGTISIAPGGVTSTELATGAVGNTNIAANAVNSSQIIDGTIADADISGTANIAVAKLATGTNGQVLTINAGVPTWQTSAALVNPMTTLGDIITGGVAGTPTRLGAGSNAQILTVTAGVPSWQNAPPPTGTAGGDLSGSYPNPTIGATAATGNNIITSINSAATLINGARVNTSFGAQNISTTGTLASGATTVTGLTVSGTTTTLNTVGYTWPAVQGGAGTILTNSGTGALTWTAAGMTNPLTSNGDIIYGVGSTPTRLAAGTGFLRGGAVPSYSAVNLASTDVTGVLPIANGGTGAATAPLARTALGLGTLSTLSSVTTTEITDGTIANVDIANVDAGKITTGTLPIARGGTNVGATPTNGQLLIGNGTGYALNTLTAGAGINITPGAGTITIAATGGSSNLDALTDVTVATPALGQMLIYDGTSVFNNRSLSGDILSVSAAGAVTLNNSSATRTNLGLGTMATVANPLTTNGDIIYGTAATPTRLPIGANNQVLTVNAGLPSWQPAPGFANPMTTPGDLIVGGVAGAPTRLAAPGASRAILGYNGTTETWVTGANNQLLGTDGTGNLTFINQSGFASSALPNGNILVGNAGVATATVMSGDATLSAAGVLSLAAGSVSGGTAGDITDGTITAADLGVGAVDLATTDVTGTLPIAQGGTNSTATPTNGGVGYGTGTAHAYSVAGTSGQLLQSNGAAAPTWVNAPTAGWGLTGNAGTNPATNFIGTTDAQPLRFGTGVGGVERMRIDATGNVGIGTTTPGVKLAVAGAGPVFGTDNSSQLQAKNTGGTYETWLIPRENDNTTYMFYGANGFNIRNNSSVSTMFMDNANNVGIGTTTPGKKLDVVGQTVNQGPALRLANSGYTHLLELYPGHSADPNPFILVKGGDPLRFATDASGFTETMRIAANGNLGVGTPAPASKLTVGAGNIQLDLERSLLANNPTDVFSFQAKSVPQYSLGWYLDTETPGLANGWLSSFAGLRIFTGGTQRMRISDNGNISIGTASPATNAALDIQSTTKGLLIPRLTTAQRDAIAGPELGLMVYNTTTSAFNFYNGGSWGAVGGGGGFSTNNAIPRGNGSGLVSSTIQDDGTTASIGAAPVATNRLTVTNSTSGILQAINATNSQVGAGSSIGIRADASGSTNNNFGVNATASGSGTNGSTGVLGSATGTTTNFGIQGNASGGTTNWAGFFGAGNVHITNGISVGATPGTFGTSGQVLTSAGAGVAPTWTTPGGGGLISSSGSNTLKAGNSTSGLGIDNAIFGNSAGAVNTGNYNVFIGANAALSKTSGDLNTIIGWYAGNAANTAAGNTLVGAQAGENTTGAVNTFIGEKAGQLNTTGNQSVYIGNSAGNTNTTGDGHVIIGNNADVGSASLSNATAIGFRAQVNQSNSLVLGSISGVNGAASSTNVGIGTTTPAHALDVTGYIRVAAGSGTANEGLLLATPAAGTSLISAGGRATTNFIISQTNNAPMSFNTNNLERMRIDGAGNVGIGTNAPGTNRLFVSVPSTDATNPVALRIDNNYTGASSKFGIDVNVDGAGSGLKYGISSSVVGLAGDASTNYGYQVSMTPNGTGTATALYSSISSAGTGQRYGFYNQVNAGLSNTSTIYGAYNAVSNSGSGNSYILYGSNSSSGAGVDYGLFLTGEDQNYFSGEVGIGISSPTKKLHVVKSPIALYDGAIVGSSTATDNSGFFGAMAYDGGGTNFGVYAHSDAIANTASLGVNRAADGALVNFMSAGVVEGQISVSGTTITYGAFTGVHYAQTENEKIERGMLVSLNGNNSNLHNLKTSELVYGIDKTAVPNDSKVMGAYLGLMDPLAAKSADNPVQIMAVGNGDMWVVDNGKDLEVGDYLISSDLPGYAMLDKGDYDISHIIARVGENINWNEVQQTVNGKKVMNVSVFFENFEVNHKAAKLMAEIKELQTKVSSMKETQDNELAALKKQMEEVMRIVGAEAKKKN